MRRNSMLPAIVAALAACPPTESIEEIEARRAERNRAEAARHPATKSKERSPALERLIGKRKHKWRIRL